MDLLTPDEPGLAGAITSFRLHGDGSRERNIANARTLLDEFGIFTVARSGLAKGDCVRVTPPLYSSPADAAKLVAALRVMAARRQGLLPGTPREMPVPYVELALKNQPVYTWGGKGPANSKAP